METVETKSKQQTQENDQAELTDDSKNNSTNMQSIRAFYAIKLSEECRNATETIIEELRQREWSQYVRWTANNNLHITLRFLGNVNQQQLETMNNSLAEQFETIRPFSLNFKEPRLFPHFRKPKVVAILIPHNDSLSQLAEIVEQSAINVGLEAQTRQFKAHLTLGRCNKSFPKRIKIEPMPTTPDLLVNSISLYQSILSESGPTYIELKTIRLSGS